MTWMADAARALNRVSSIPLITLTLMDSSVIRISDRVKVVGGNTYEPLLLSAGDIEENVSRGDSTAQNADYTMKLRNSPVVVGGTAYASLVAAHDARPLNGARVSVSYIFVKDDGQETADELQFYGVAESPKEITRLSLALRCGGLPEYLAKAFALAKMFAADYPLCLPSDSGKPFPYLLGQFKAVECRRTRWPVYESDNETLLNGAINASATTIVVDSTVGFGDFGDEEKVIWIDGERITWTAKTTTPQQFTGCVRGTAGGSAAASHADNVAVKEHPETTAEVTVAAHGLASLDALYGEYGDLLAPISLADCTPTLAPARSYVVIPKTALVVPQTLLDTIGVNYDGAPAHNAYPAENDGFGTSGTNTSKKFTWPANPYLTVGGDPMYTDCKIAIKYSIKENSIAYPSNIQDQSDDASLYYSLNGSTWILMWHGVTTFDAFGGAWIGWSRSQNVYCASTYYISRTALQWGDDVWLSWTQPDTKAAYGFDAEVSYTCLLNANAVTKTGTVADEKYFRRIFAAGWGLPSSNAIYGTVGTAVSRPDHVMKSWLVEKCGYSTSEIDTASFDEAGTFYAAQSPPYALSVRVEEDVDPEDAVYQMAFESRSIVYFALGKWYLKVIPSTAPASMKTIDRGDLAGEGAEFDCSYTDDRDVVNKVVLRWDRNNGPAGDKDRYRKSAEVSNVIGDYPVISKDLELDMVYGDAQANDVATIYLAQRNRVLKTISFLVFWDSTGLQIGDTITPSGMGFWDGIKFYIEGSRRAGVNRATFNAVEWWG